MTETRILKIGIIGAGSIVRERHIPGIVAAGGAEIVAVCNSTIESARAFCAEFAPDATPFDKYYEVIAHPEVDIIWIGTHPDLHCQLSVASLRAGKHVFCQARMAMNLAEAEEMWETSLSNPELVAVLCPPPMGLRGDLWIKGALADGLIGTPHQVVLRSLNSAYLDMSAPPHWRQLYSSSGLQTLTLGIYIEVLQRWLGNISAVSAHGNIITPVRDGVEIDAPDLLHVLCTFAGGVEGSLSFSGVADHAGGDRLEIYGSEGTIIYDFETETVKIGRRGEAALETVEIPPELERHWTVEADFLNAVRKPDAPRPTPDFSEGLLYMRVVEAVHASLESGTRIPIH